MTGRRGSGGRVPGERLYRALLLLHPKAFRRRYGPELLDCFRAAWREEGRGRGVAAGVGFWVRMARGTLGTVWRQRVRDRRSGQTEWGGRVAGMRTLSGIGGLRAAMDGLSQDVRHGLRMFRRNPGFTVAALATLGLSVGAATAVFAVVNGILLRPLPYPEPDRLYEVSQNGPDGSYWLSVPNYRDMKAALGAFQVMGAYTPDGANVMVNGEPARVNVAEADADFFRALGVEPVLGRTFTARERAAGAPVAVVSHAMWEERLGGRADAIGTKLVLGGEPREVIGVLPAGEMVPADADVWTPLNMESPDWRTRRGIVWIKVVARLRPGASLATARAQAATLSRTLRARFPDADDKLTVGYRSLQEAMVGSVRTELRILMAAVALLLLVAAFNVGGLLLTRATSRRGELAVRAALGGGRRRLMAQLLTESALLGLLGCLLGIALARLGVAALVRAAPVGTPRLDEVTLGGGALRFAVVAAFGSALLFGVLPTFATMRGQGAALRSARSAGERSGTRLRGGLVVAQVALALSLLFTAGLLGKSFWRLHAVDLGFRPQGVLVAGLPIDDSDFGSAEARALYYQSILERAAALPGVRHAALTSAAPFTGFGVVFSYALPDLPHQAEEQEEESRFRIVTPDLFATLGIRFLRGRTFTAEETVPGHPMGAVVSQEMVRQDFNGRDPIGARIITAGDTFHIVGVVDAVRDVSARSSSPFPHVYVPVLPAKRQSMMLVVRTDGDPAALMGPIRRAVHEIRPSQPVTPLRPMSELIADSAAQPRFTLLLLTFFAAATLLLAGIGLYGVLAFAVATRTREIGVRVALGAPPGAVRSLVLRQSLALTAVGLAAGLLLAAWGARLVQAMLFQVHALDPAILVVVASTLLAVAVLAAWIPARRATHIAPVEALKAE